MRSLVECEEGDDSEGTNAPHRRNNYPEHDHRS